MATEVLRPDGNDTSVWNVNTYANIDDAVLTGNAGDGSTVHADRFDDNSTQIWTMEDSSLDNATQIVVHFRAYADDAAIDDMFIRPVVGDADAITEQNESNISNNSYQWFSKTFTPAGSNWTNAQLNDLKISFRTTTMSSDEEFFMDVMYVVVTGDTYSGGGGESSGPSKVATVMLGNPF